MAGYTRQSIADIINGAEITAPPVNAEFNQLSAAFNGSTGHSHDGSTGNAPPINLTTSVAGYLPAVHGGVGGKNNTTATTNPLVTDDSTQGYAPGSIWENTTTGRVFICVGNTAGAAVWRELVQVQTGNVIFPETNDTVDLGSNSNRFQDLFLSGGIAAAGNVSFGGTMTVTGAASLSSTLNVTGLSTLASVDINGGAIDGTVIGSASRAAGNFTTISTTGQATLASADINGGTIDGAVVGGSSPSAVTGTNITANTAFIGPLTGNVTGNVTGNLTGSVTGNVTGNVTGDVTSSGTSTFNNVTVNGSLNLNAGTAGTVTGLSAPVNATDAATKTYVDAADATKLNLSGGTMSGAIAMGGNKVTGVGTPTASTDAATKGYVDTSVSNLVDAAPGALDTLNELAAALGDDPNFSTTITNSIATKLPLAGGTMTGDITLGDHKITSTAAPATDDTLTRKGYVDDQIDTRLPLAGGTMSGAIAMGDNKVTGLGTPTAGTDAATKAYADAADATKLNLSGGTMTGGIVMGANKITSTATPTVDDDLTRKGYVDNILGSATAAADSAAAAAISESNAATSESNASNSASAASTSENNAANSASAAAQSANEAAASAASINPNNIDINGGTIDGVTIGATSAGAATFTSATINGNITVTGTVDGRDVATDGSKLDGIEANADVTDTANVTAAGALMDSELTDEAAVKALDQGVATTDSPSFAGLTATTADINGGTIDGTVIGGSTPAAISGTTGTFSGNLTVDTDTLFVDASGNRVGIGTSSPAYDLHVNNIGMLSTSSVDTYYFLNDGDFKIAQAGVGTRMTLNSSGNVGIGTSSPASLLHLNTPGVSATSGGLRVGQAGWTVQYGYLELDTASTKFKLGTSGVSFPLAFETNSTERMRIDSSGNVGIGTTTPAAKLHVEGGSLLVDAYSVGEDAGIFLREGFLTIDQPSITVWDGSNAGVSPDGLSINAFDGIRFRTAGSERMRIDSSGNVGIGTSSPAVKFHVAGGDGNQIRYSGATHSAGLGISGTDPFVGSLTNAPMVFLTNAAERMRIDSSGNVGIGTSSPDQLLHLSANTGATLRFESTDTTIAANEIIGAIEWEGNDATVGSSGVVGKIDLIAEDATPEYAMRFFTHDNLSGVPDFAERMRIDSSGNLLVGATSSQSTVGDAEGIELRGGIKSGVFTRDSGTALFACRRGSDGSAIEFRKNTGIVGSISVTATNTSYNTSSDYRLKEDVQPMVGASNRLMALKPVNFAWKVDGSRVDGFLAHEAQAVVPEAVTGAKDAVDKDGKPEYQGIDQSKLLPVVVAALQDSIKRIEALEAEVLALKGGTNA